MTVPVRCEVVVLAATKNVTAPLPLPEAVCTVIHELPLVDDQLQPEVAVMLTVPLALPAAKVNVDGLAE